MDNVSRTTQSTVLGEEGVDGESPGHCKDYSDINGMGGDPSEYDEVDAIPKLKVYTWFDVLLSIISILTYLCDVGMDLYVCYYFYSLERYWYFSLTLIFTLVPALVMTAISLRWYINDCDNISLPSVPMWRWSLRIVFLILQISPVLRYADSIYYGIKFRTTKEIQAKSTYFVLMLYEDADATLVRLIECFLESGPQLLLQLFILLTDHSLLIRGSEIDSEFNATLQAVSVLSSVISLAWALAAYHRSVRFASEAKANISKLGTIFQIFWHFFGIVSRVLAIVLFASEFMGWMFVFLACHWVLMIIWLLSQQARLCQNRCEEFMFICILAFVYIFSYFNVKDNPTRYRYLFYYSVCFVENVVLLTAWFIAADSRTWYYYPAFIAQLVSFFLAVLFMCIYYAYLHPTGKVEIVFSLTDNSSPRSSGSSQGEVKSSQPERETQAVTT